MVSEKRMVSMEDLGYNTAGFQVIDECLEML